MRVKGKAWVFGDNIDTDCITPSRYLDRRLSGAEWVQFCFEDLNPQFSKEVQPGDFVVAGENFGCGSSRESAPDAIKHCGVKVVIAKSFARIFFRNAVNIGLLPIVAPEVVDGTRPGDDLEVDTEQGIIKNLTTEVDYEFHPIPAFLQAIVDSGGLIEYVKRKISSS